MTDIDVVGQPGVTAPFAFRCGDNYHHELLRLLVGGNPRSLGEY